MTNPLPFDKPITIRPLLDGGFNLEVDGVAIRAFSDFRDFADWVNWCLGQSPDTVVTQAADVNMVMPRIAQQSTGVVKGLFGGKQK